MRLIATLAALALAGCAMPPMSQEESAYWSRHFAEQARINNQAAADAQRAIINPQRPSYQTAPAQMAPLTATWTGASNVAQSVTGATGFNCEYYYGGRKFWRMFAGSCPSSIQIQ